MVKYIINNFN